MSTVKELAEALAAAQEGLQAAVERVPADHYAPLPGSNEWSTAQVVAHAVEFQPFWAQQVRRMLTEDSPAIGRLDEAARRERLAAVERGAKLPREQALKELRRAAGEALKQVRSLTAGQLSRKGVLTTLDLRGSQERTVAQLIESVLIAHLREHAEQVGRLGTG